MDPLELYPGATAKRSSKRASASPRPETAAPVRMPKHAASLVPEATSAVVTRKKAAAATTSAVPVAAQAELAAERQPKRARTVETSNTPPAVGADEAVATLTAEQSEALRVIVDGKENVFVTGAAGVGKSTLLRALIRALPAKGLAICAMTGMAAVPLGGVTLHRWSGVGLGLGMAQQLLAAVEGSAEAVRRWKATHTLVVDEISMLDARLFDALDFIGSAVRSSRAPFGGIRLVLMGDFAQLPPVAGAYCFTSARWPAVVQRTVQLTQVVRQREPQLIAALNELRLGRASPATLALFNSRVGDADDAADSILHTRLCARRRDVAHENAQMLRQLPGVRGTLYRSQDVGSPHYLDDCAAPAELRLKVGAQVVLVRTLPLADGGLVNGSRGVVTGLGVADGWPTVRFVGGVQRTIGPVRWTITQGGRDVASRTQIPLALAWSITIHRAQGMTIDRLAVDLSGVFDNGMAFVALSRCRTSAGLRLLTPLTERVVRAHPAVVALYTPSTPPPQPRPSLLSGCVVCVLGKQTLHTRAQLLALLQQHGAIVESANVPALTHAIVGTHYTSATKQAAVDTQLRALAASVVRWTEAELLDELERRGGGDGAAAAHAPGPQLVAPPPVVELL